MSKALDEMVERLCSGLDHASIKSCSVWAEQKRVMGKPFPGPYSFKYHPWSKAMHDSKYEYNYGMKAAQMGFTETLLNRCFYSIDILKEDVLYVLPNAKPDATDFSSSRFDSALDLSPHLENLFSDVKNVGHKRAGSANMYIRGSKSRSQLKSISTPVIILDEVEEFDQENIPLAFERASGQAEEDRCIWMISTPHLPKKGIDLYYKESSQQHFFFKCPCCSKRTELIYPECLAIFGENENDPRVRESHYICKECKGKLPQESKVEWLASGEWVPAYHDRPAAGWHIPQMYSMTIEPSSIAMVHFKAQKDPAQEKELYNSKLGVPHVTKGAQVTDEDLFNCQGQYQLITDWYRGNLVTMGVDVGKFFHAVISEWEVRNSNKEDVNEAAWRRMIACFKFADATELDRLMQRFGVRHCVIDANPERRTAEAFASHFPGRVSLCFYGNNIRGRTISLNEVASTITVDRTSWLDQSLGRVRKRLCQIPMNTDLEFKEHMKNQVRTYGKDKDGNPVAKYESIGEDHYGHAWNYDEMALPLAYSRNSNQNIGASLV